MKLGLALCLAGVIAVSTVPAKADYQFQTFQQRLNYADPKDLRTFPQRLFLEQEMWPERPRKRISQKTGSMTRLS